MVEALVCPSCGAPLPPGAAARVTCAFCKRTSSASDLVSAPAATPSTSRCPRCSVSLFTGASQGLSVLGCGLCGGVWLDNASAQRVMQRYDDAVVELAGRAGSHATVRPDVRARVGCAVCGQPMQRRAIRGVEIDLCEVHGTWFDAGELVLIVSALRAPRQGAAVFEGPTTVGSLATDVAGDVAVGVAAEVAGGIFEAILEAIF